MRKLAFLTSFALAAALFILGPNIIVSQGQTEITGTWTTAKKAPKAPKPPKPPRVPGGVEIDPPEPPDVDFGHKDSNDPDKDYRGNVLTLTTRLVW